MSKKGSEESLEDELKILASIDNLTIVGQLHDINTYGLQTCINHEHTRVEGSLLAGKAKGTFFHGGSGGFYFEFDSIRGKALNRRNFRLEYNPNNVSYEQKEFIKINLINKLDDISFSRCDLALDINIDLSSYKIETPKAVKENLWLSPSGKLETLYKGSPNSQHRIRMYDKKLERKEKADVIVVGEMWRVEHQIRGKKVESLLLSDFDAFKDMRIIAYDLEGIEGTWKEEKLLKYFLLTNDFSGMSPATITRYKNKIKNISGHDVVPKFQEKIKKELPNLKREFEFWKPIPNFFEIYNRQWY